MKIAIVGCAHGELQRIYEEIATIESKGNIKIDLLLICGDFQSVRNSHDLKCMAVPEKFYKLGTFHMYYSGQLTAPILTIFIGGNHEASNYLQTLPYGGFVAPNIYYMGYANVIQYAGLRIGGVSGIYNKGKESFGHFERLPYDENTKRSAYHVRRLEIHRLLQLNNNDDPNRQLIDIMMTHDWPINIHTCGDVNWLLRVKKHFKDDIYNHRLGNPLFEPLMRHLKPKHWFSAHLHVRFEAIVNHNQEGTVQTKFLALDKVLGNRRFLEIIDIPNPSDDYTLRYDPEWMTVLRATNKLMSIDRNPPPVPALWRQFHNITDGDIQEVVDMFNSKLEIPKNFQMSEPAINGLNDDLDPERVRNYLNPQTVEFCSKLNLTDPIKSIIDSLKPQPNPDQISISDDEDDDATVETELERQQKKIKLEEANVHGEDLFFIDRKGDDKSKVNLITNDISEKHMYCNYNQGIDSNIVEHHQTYSLRSGIGNDEKMCQLNVMNQITDVESASETNNQTVETGSASPPLSKRAKARRAKKLKNKLEVKAMVECGDGDGDGGEHRDRMEGDVSIQSKNCNKFEDTRRAFILQRLEWVKQNLPMRGDNEEIRVLPVNQINRIQRNLTED